MVVAFTRMKTSTPETQTQPSVGADWRARLETSCDNSDLSEMEQQVIEQLPSGYFYDPEECVIVRNSPDLPECVELVTGLGQRISVPTAGVVLGLTEGCAQETGE